MTVTASLLTAGTGPTNVATEVTASVSPTVRGLQLLWLNYSRGSSTLPTAPTSIVGNAITWTLVGSSNYDNAGVGRRTVFLYRAQPTAPTVGTTTITHSFSHADGHVTYEWMELGNVVDDSANNGAAALVQAVFGSLGTNDTPSSTLAAFADAANATAGFVAYGVGGLADPTPGSGFTLVDGESPALSGQPVSTAVEFRSDPDTSVDLTLAAGGGINGRVLCGVEIAAGAIDQVLIGNPSVVNVVSRGGTLQQPTVDNFRRPRRANVWIHGYDGERINVLS